VRDAAFLTRLVRHVQRNASREFAQGEQFGTALHSSFIVHREDMNCRTALGSEPDTPGAMKSEMFRPRVPPRMEERHEFSARGVDAREVRPFMSVASIAGQGQVARVVGPTVLFGDDVFDVMREAALFLP
jgi:hypothetical protein